MPVPHSAPSAQKPVPVLNLGVLAHVDAGKTSLTERLLYLAGVVPELGSVDRGTTTTDSLDLERRRGITIRTAVASFTLQTPAGPRLVDLVDTPGHPDFVAEVERALAVLDGVVLVVSAVEGVQARTRVLMRVVRRLRLPCLLFVNKIDRAGADPGRVTAEIAAELTPAIVSLVDVSGAGSRSATVTPRRPPAVAESLAEHDDTLLEAWAAGRADAELVAEQLAARTAGGPMTSACSSRPSAHDRKASSLRHGTSNTTDPSSSREMTLAAPRSCSTARARPASTRTCAVGGLPAPPSPSSFGSSGKTVATSKSAGRSKAPAAPGSTSPSMRSTRKVRIAAAPWSWPTRYQNPSRERRA